MRWITHLDTLWADRQARQLHRQLHTVEGPWSPRVRVTSPQGQTRELLAFCSNDYLGLANHPQLTAALSDGAQRWGVGSGAAHLVSGHSRAHATLEADLAGVLAAHIPGVQVLTFGTGYMANLAVLGGVAEQDATIFSDKLNHASIVDGTLLAKAWTRCKVERYPHADVDALRTRLQACTSAYRFIVTDSVFSMDGDIAPLRELLKLADTFDAALIIDDAHGFGVLGPHGGGALEHFGLRSERLILMGTLGKAAGVGGAFIGAHRSVTRWLLNTARAYIYTTATPPALAHTASASLQLIRSAEGAQRRKQLKNAIKQLRAGVQPLLISHGWSLVPSETPIQALVVGDNADTLRLSQALEAQGLWVPAIRPPTVPEGSARLRIALNATHTAAEINQLVAALHMASDLPSTPT